MHWAQKMRAIARISNWIGVILVGPVTLGLLYAYTWTDRDQVDTIRSKDYRWHLNYEIRENCSVDMAERIRCPEKSLVMPPTISELLAHWVYAGTLVLGMGATHLFIAVLMIAIINMDFQVAFVGYASLLCFWAVVGTSSYGSDLALRVTHFVAAGCTFMLTFAYTAIMVTKHRHLFGSTLAYVIQILMGITNICMVIVFAVMSQMPSNNFGNPIVGGIANTEFVHGLVSIGEQVYLLLYCLQSMVVMRNYFKNEHVYAAVVSEDKQHQGNPNKFFDFRLQNGNPSASGRMRV